MFYIASEVARLIEAHNAREAFILSLPDDEQKTMREKDAQERKDAKAHARALELAEASRPRNFWGK